MCKNRVEGQMLPPPGAPRRPVRPRRKHPSPLSLRGGEGTDVDGALVPGLVCEAASSLEMYRVRVELRTPPRPSLKKSIDQSCLALSSSTPTAVRRYTDLRQLGSQVCPTSSPRLAWLAIASLFCAERRLTRHTKCLARSSAHNKSTQN